MSYLLSISKDISLQAIVYLLLKSNAQKYIKTEFYKNLSALKYKTLKCNNEIKYVLVIVRFKSYPVKNLYSFPSYALTCLLLIDVKISFLIYTDLLMT